MPASIAPFEVYAIRYARHGGRRPADNYLGSVDFHDADSDLDYYVWVARRGDEIFVVDTGFDADSARQRGRELLQRPAEGLALLGIDAAQVRDVIITHLHYDHAGNLDKLPNARFHIQDSEVEYATGRCMCHGVLRHAYSVEDIVELIRKVYDERVVFHDGDSEMAPGVRLLRIGGHTKGLQSVQVATERGNVVLASDASHFYENMDRGRPFPIIYNVADMLQGYTRLHAAAASPDHIVPGHDPRVLELYPPLSGTQRDIVQLHLQPLASVQDEIGDGAH